MNKRKLHALIAAAALATAAGSVFAAKVDVYGVIDASLRHTTNEQAPAAAKASKTAIGSGLSQSRIGFRASEDLGGGLKAFARLEHRLDADSGTVAADAVNNGAGFWAESAVGIQSKLGTVSVGRQSGVLYDLYRPRNHAFQPLTEFTLAPRSDNLIKYAGNFGNFTVAAQYGADENAGGRTVGATAAYRFGDVTAKVGTLTLQDDAGLKADAHAVGLDYVKGPLRLAAAYLKNDFDAGFNGTFLYADANGNYGVPTAGDGREAYMLGGSYRFGRVTVGAQYVRANLEGADGKADFTSAVVSYALSKRTSIYGEVDVSKFDGALALPNGADERVGYMIGLRHSF